MEVEDGVHRALASWPQGPDMPQGSCSLVAAVF